MSLGSRLTLALLFCVSTAFASDIPKNTKLQVRLDETLSSEFSRIGDRFTATLDKSVSLKGIALLQKGAQVEGVIKYVEATYQYQQPGRLELALVSVRSGGTLYTIDTNIVMLAGRPSPTDPRTGRPMDTGSRGGDLARAGIDATLGSRNGPSTTIPGTDISVGAGGDKSSGMRVILPAKSKLTFNLVSAHSLESPSKEQSKVQNVEAGDASPAVR